MVARLDITARRAIIVRTSIKRKNVQPGDLVKAKPITILEYQASLGIGLVIERGCQGLNDFVKIKWLQDPESGKKPRFRYVDDLILLGTEET
jgi:hypothetical protein